MTRPNERGTSLIDLLISMAIVAVLFGGIYLVYFSIISSVANISVRTAATSAINAEMETIRNLPYGSVGTVNGVPVGVIPQVQVVPVGKYSFTLTTAVRNIDDPFDGTLNGTPNDTSPADYKLISIQATCALCSDFGSLTATTIVAPKTLESATQDGSLFISVFDASGSAVPGATVHITNASVTPSIDLTDATNANGILQLVGVPTSTQKYQIVVTKTGYSTDQTYPPGDLSNPNPTKPNATVLAQTVTSISFAIDRVSSLIVNSSDNRCVAVGDVSFAVTGAKVIGTNPVVLKFSTTSVTNASGARTLSNLEWDTYGIALTSLGKSLVGTIPLNPLIINPSSTETFRLVVRPVANPALLVTVLDGQTGTGIQNASVSISTGVTPQTLTTGRATVTETDWSGGQYANQSGGIDPIGLPGALVLTRNASGTFNVGTNDWLISQTIDLGGSSSTLYGISWIGVNNVQFQVAANNDNATWNFIGPDGAAGTNFINSSSSLPASLSGNRYIRYKVYLNTDDENVTPELDAVTLEFFADCVPPAQVLFTSLTPGDYLVDVSASGYVAATTTVTVGTGTTSTIMSLFTP